MSDQVTFPQMVQASFTPVVPPLDVYINQIRMGATLMDLTIILGATEDSGTGQVTNRDRVIVRVSPATAKILLSHLQMIVSAYEEAVGPITVSQRLEVELMTIKQNIVGAFTEQMQIAEVPEQREN